MDNWKYAVNASFFGLRRDRFNQYQPDRNLAERISLVSQIPEVTGVELKYPKDFTDMQFTHDVLEKHGLSLAAVNVDTKDFTYFKYGALSAADAQTRARAVSLLREGMDIAAEFNAQIVTTCPLAEGYDYPFQVNYEQAWRAFIDAVKQAAAHRHDISLVLEYQPHEPYAKILLNNVGKMLFICQEVDAPNLGANLDIGHSFAAGESPAEAAVLLAQKGWLKYIHTNDNTGEGGDWDMVSGSIHFWDWLELLYTLRELKYAGWLSGDIQPKHFSPTDAYATNIHMIQNMTGFLDRINHGVFQEMMGKRERTPALYDYLSSLLTPGEKLPGK